MRSFFAVPVLGLILAAFAIVQPVVAAPALPFVQQEEFKPKCCECRRAHVNLQAVMVCKGGVIRERNSRVSADGAPVERGTVELE
ncbi:hypothetical protein DFJ73DRAFT_774100 [Zopfochytrium polystomum]|nr:hypothetical protein DFJ73DRAFT_774100 [Zopfochytrium polystomum]